MSELSEAINEMRNMRESYDQIAGAAEAYNTGKVQLAENITSKGVEASATETLPELAEKVAAISQETYEINGGEMYAKQLFGSLETPKYWNLYDVLAQLLSDGRLVSYGGILLAEYYRGYDSLALSGAGAGGAYVVSDMENGQFKMYTEDTTHTWATEFDGYGNRWVAYCFADEYHDFQITDTNTSPRNIFIGRKVGTITSLVAGRANQIVVPDGNELKDFDDRGGQNYAGRIVLRNIKEHTSGNCIVLPKSVYSIYCKIGKINGGSLIVAAFNENSRNDCSVILDFTEEENTSPANIFLGNSLKPNYSPLFIIRGCKKYIGNFADTLRGIDVFIAEDLETWVQHSSYDGFSKISEFHKAYFPSLEGIENIGGYRALFSSFPQYIYFGYKQNDKTRSIVGLFIQAQTITTDIELKEGYCKPIDLHLAQGLTKENVQAHIFDRLGVNDLSTGAVTITLATAVLNLFTQEEIDAVVARTNITIVGA